MGVRLNDLTVGDTWSFNVTAADYPAPTWTLTLYLVPRFTTPAQSPITLTSAPADSEHSFAVAATVTATYKPGQYGFMTVASDGTQRFTLDGSEWSGEVVLRPDPSVSVQGDDHRTQAQKALDDLKAALATYTATQGHIDEYEINGRRMKFRSALGIENMIAFWQKERAAEIRADAIARGMADPRKVYVAFNR
jgi:enamine deaminase RidA (YjgF/YER057c/UK114 family)